MKRSKPTATKVAVEKAPTRYVPDPHRRHRIVESRKIYTRKARPKVGPSDFRGPHDVQNSDAFSIRRISP